MARSEEQAGLQWAHFSDAEEPSLWRVGGFRCVVIKAELSALTQANTKSNVEVYTQNTGNKQYVNLHSDTADTLFLYGASSVRLFLALSKSQWGILVLWWISGKGMSDIKLQGTQHALSYSRDPVKLDIWGQKRSYQRPSNCRQCLPLLDCSTLFNVNLISPLSFKQLKGHYTAVKQEWTNFREYN